MIDGQVVPGFMAQVLELGELNCRFHQTKARGMSYITPNIGLLYFLTQNSEGELAGTYYEWSWLSGGRAEVCYVIRVLNGVASLVTDEKILQIIEPLLHVNLLQTTQPNRSSVVLGLLKKIYRLI